jgi:hypothetical protein
MKQAEVIKLLLEIALVSLSHNSSRASTLVLNSFDGDPVKNLAASA